jgi:hypothetical protein
LVGRDEIVDILIKEGIDINITDDYGRTAFHDGFFKK